MSGSGASNLGYSNITPFSNINGNYVNVDNSQYAGRFGSNEIPGSPPGPLPGLAGAKSNIDAAAGKVPGICMNGGGTKNLKRKIKNISRRYKRMKAGSRKIRSIKRRIRRRVGSRRMSRSRRHSRRQRGGYAQYQNNLPLTPSYQVAGINLPSSQLALANPPPITAKNTCIDNYNANTGIGFPSKGH